MVETAEILVLMWKCGLHRAMRMRAYLALAASVVLACAPEAETTRLGDYDNDGKIVIACLGDSNTCYGGAGECGHRVDPYCHQLREMMPKSMVWRGREREILILNFGWNGARVERSDARDFRYKPVDRFRLAVQIEWATSLEARDREPRLVDYPRHRADVVIMAFGTNDYEVFEEDWWKEELEPDWWPPPRKREFLFPRRPEEVSAALFRQMDRTEPTDPARGELQVRAYVALLPVTSILEQRTQWDERVNEAIRRDFAERSLPAELLIDFAAEFDNPDYYGFEDHYGQIDRFHVNTQGQTRRAQLLRETLCEDADHDCVPEN